MSNRELLERCQKFLEGVETDHESHEEHNLYMLVEDIQDELFNPSQSEGLNLAKYWKRKFDELKSKLAEAEKDVKRYQWLYDRPANIPGPQCFMVDERGRPYYPVKGNDLTILIDQHFDIAEPQTISNNTKGLG